MDFGIDWDGESASKCYQPSVRSFAQTLADSGRRGRNIRDPIPTPSNWTLSLGQQIKLEIPMGDWQISDVCKFRKFTHGGDVRFRRVYAYAATSQLESQVSKSEGAKTPIFLQCAAKFNFRNGSASAEIDESWVYARVQAFSSICGPRSLTRPWKLGDAICGLAESTSRNHNKDQLAGWDLCSFDGRINVAARRISGDFEQISPIVSTGFVSFWINSIDLNLARSNRARPPSDLRAPNPLRSLFSRAFADPESSSMLRRESRSCQNQEVGGGLSSRSR